MTIASAITAAQGRVADAYTAISNKGGTLPATQNLANMPTAINSINTGGGGSSKYGATADTFLGDIDANGILKRPSGVADLVFTGVQDIDYYGLYYKFEYTNITTLSFPDLISISNPYGCNCMCANSAIISASMPKLTTISAVNACSRMFYYCLNLTSVYLPELTSVTGQAAMEYFIAYCPNVTSISLPKLSVLTGSNAMRNFCYGSTGIEHIYFNSLTTTSFGSYKNQFTGMMQGTGTNVTHTLHFPSNLTSKIGGLSGYPLFSGTSGYVVCAFDLPATN